MLNILSRLQEYSEHDIVRCTCMKQQALVRIASQLPELLMGAHHVALAMSFLSCEEQLCLANVQFSFLSRGWARAADLRQWMEVNFEGPCCHTIHSSGFG